MFFFFLNVPIGFHFDLFKSELYTRMILKWCIKKSSFFSMCKNTIKLKFFVKVWIGMCNMLNRYVRYVGHITQLPTN